MDALVWVVSEDGFDGASVSAVCKRARVSHRTFHSAYPSLEGAFVAVLDDGFRRTISIVAAALRRSDDWREGIREALLDLLLFLQAEPRLARVWLIDSAAAGAWALRRRERNVDALAEAIVAKVAPSHPVDRHRLASVSVVASVIRVIQSHLLEERTEPLVTLLGPLMGLVASSYLEAHDVAAEAELAAEVAARHLANQPERQPISGLSTDDLPAILLDPRAHRARSIVCYLSRHPSASNRTIADAVGIPSHTQISTLLSRLTELGLVSKLTRGAGYSNAWWLTEYGRDVAGLLLEPAQAS